MEGVAQGEERPIGPGYLEHLPQGWSGRGPRQLRRRTHAVEHLIRAIEDHQRPALDDLARRTDAAWMAELETYAASD